MLVAQKLPKDGYMHLSHVALQDDCKVHTLAQPHSRGDILVRQNNIVILDEHIPQYGKIRHTTLRGEPFLVVMGHT